MKYTAHNPNREYFGPKNFNDVSDMIATQDLTNDGILEVANMMIEAGYVRAGEQVLKQYQD